MSILAEHFERIREGLLAKAKETGVLDHAPSKGTARELIVSDFLETSLPREYDFSGGEIVAPNGSRSGQLDVMLISRSAPQFQVASRLSLALLHSVAAVIEVK